MAIEKLSWSQSLLSYGTSCVLFSGEHGQRAITLSDDYMPVHEIRCMGAFICKFINQSRTNERRKVQILNIDTVNTTFADMSEFCFRFVGSSLSLMVCSCSKQLFRLYHI